MEYSGTIPLEERPQVLKDLQTAFRELVEEDIATNIEIQPEDQASELCKNVDMKDFGGGKDEPTDIRIVTVAGFYCVCGGTHVQSTGELKANGWTITGIKSKKGVVRVKYGRVS